VRLDAWRQDVRVALRRLARTPGFTAAAVGTLAISMGAATAVFSVVDTVVFRPLPYAEPERLVKIWSVHGRERFGDMSLPDFLDIQAQAGVFEQVAADDWGVGGALVTTNWLSTLGVRPVLGRDFRSDDATPGRERVAILTDVGWRRRFGGDPSILGRTIDAGGERLTVIGVLPANVLRFDEDLLRPLVPSLYHSARRDYRDLDVVARLKPDVTLDQAQAELVTVAGRLAREHPDTNAERGARLGPLLKRYAGITPGSRTSRALVLTFAAVALVLLIACANVAGLMLVRATAHQRESLIRAALGADRVRLVRQWMTEALIVFAAGGGAGLLLAGAMLDALVAFAVAGRYASDRMTVAIDGRVLAFGFLVPVTAGVLFGLGPALRAGRPDLGAALREGGSAGTRTRARRTLLVAEVALSMVLLVGFGLLVRSLHYLDAVPLGLDPHGVVLTASDATGATPAEFPRQVSFWREAVTRVRALPGVETAAVTNKLPFAARQKRFTIEGHADVPKDRQPAAGDVFISPGFFESLRIPLRYGRTFTEADDAAAVPVAIVSESLARRYFPGQSAIGRRVRLDERRRARADCCNGDVGGGWREIVGVVGDVRQGGLDEASPVAIYRPYSQIVEHDMSLVVRTRSDTAAPAMAAAVRRELAEGWSAPTTLHAVLAAAPSRRLLGFLIAVLGAFAAVAVLLTSIGLYGLAAQIAAERTREVGLRMALGATRRAVVASMVADMARLAAGGLFLGVLAAVVLARSVSSLLFEVTGTDAATYAAVVLVLAALTVAAAYFPARRAAGIDPVAALRHE
jgi:putative ABC transport system permease protein